MCLGPRNLVLKEAYSSAEGAESRRGAGGDVLPDVCAQGRVLSATERSKGHGARDRQQVRRHEQHRRMPDESGFKQRPVKENGAAPESN